MAKRDLSAVSASKQRDTHAAREKSLKPAFSRDLEPIAFPAVRDTYTGASAIGVSGVYAGVRMTLGARVCSGSWRRADGTQTFKWSRWVEFERTVEVKSADRKRTLFSRTMAARELIPETCYEVVAIVRKDAA